MVHSRIIIPQEFYSHEKRHELIVLALSECHVLQNTTPRLLCGRAPHLVPCSDEALGRLSACANGVTPQLREFRGRRCRSECFSAGPGNHSCPTESLRHTAKL